MINFAIFTTGLRIYAFNIKTSSCNFKYQLTKMIQERKRLLSSFWSLRQAQNIFIVHKDLFVKVIPEGKVQASKRLFRSEIQDTQFDLTFLGAGLSVSGPRRPGTPKGRFEVTHHIAEVEDQ